uniref:4Fe-4S ferredoxin-type domain-containing protein n=1 Tax=candidate division WOR-3 bacterium TaxID=2052148 RepID=A0A7V3UZW7_UNCW3
MAELLLNELDTRFKYRIAERMGDDSFLNCFACGSCTASCPVRRLDEKYNPRRLIRMAILGLKDEVYKSEFLWLCSYHSTCLYRCPQKVNIGAVCDAVTRIRQQFGESHWSDGVNVEFRREVVKLVPGVSVCFVCGSCTAVCPESYLDPNKDPRKFIRKVNLGLAKAALNDEFKDICATHFRCETRCPQGVKISRVMQVLRELAIEDGYTLPESLRFLRD